jgi:hypothetical protein
MVWPPLDSESDWDAVTASYAAAAAAANAVLFPAGEALRSAYHANPGMVLFDSDGFHPAPLGSEGVALVIYAVAANVSPVGLTERAGGSTFPPAHIATLEAAAADAIARYDH